MWARKLGVPDYWPSRAKVFVGGTVYGFTAVTILSFLTDSHIGYLDTADPVEKKQLCLTLWPTTRSWRHWTSWDLRRDEFPKQHACHNATRKRGSCSDIHVPIARIRSGLGFPLADRANKGSALEIYSAIFLYLGFCLFWTTTAHDFLLTFRTGKDRILDWQSFTHKFPILFKTFMISSGLNLLEFCLADGRKALRVLGWALVPAVTAWGMICFAFIWWPIALCTYMRYPWNLARLAVFCDAILFSIYGLVLTVHALVFIRNSDMRPMYALTWQMDDCICGCTYKIKEDYLKRFMYLGLGCAYKGVALAVRCLKGLRRSNWATLLLVRYPIPLTVYPVEWTTQDGEAIQHRERGEAVQAELAFDPFALMDEQPDSYRTTCKLNPLRRRKAQRKLSKETSGPAPRLICDDEFGMDTTIGCCGCPADEDLSFSEVQLLETSSRPLSPL